MGSRILGETMIFDIAYDAYLFACNQIELENTKEIFVTFKEDKYHVSDIGFLADGRKEFKLKLKTCPSTGCKNKVAGTNMRTYLGLKNSYSGRLCSDCRIALRGAS